MKIGLITDWYRPRVGGIELHLHNLAAQLSARGHEVVVVTPTPGEACVDGIRVRRIEAPLAPGFGFLTTAGGVRAVGRALAEEGVDVAHCHVSIVSPAALGGAREAHLREVPTALTFHSIVPKTRWLARAVDFVMGTSAWPARFSAVSERVAADVQPMAGERAVTVIPNGIDVGFWKRQGLGGRVDGSGLRVVTVMRLNAKKRPLALIPVIRKVISDVGRGLRVSLHIVGDGPQRKALEAAIRRAGLGHCVELLGQRTREEIRALLGESDLFVMPAIRESFGLAALEARCVGLPVVAMARSGVAEVIAHAREGLLARSDAELAEHVVTLARDRGLRERIARHNRDTSPPYDWPTVIDQHLALYREAIALRASV